MGVQLRIGVYSLSDGARGLMEELGPDEGSCLYSSSLVPGFNKCFHKVAPKAVERLADDWDRLVTFYQFPREQWQHLRTTNIVESPFAMVRLRTTAAKRFKKEENATALIWKVVQIAESTFRRLKGAELLPAVYAGVQYVDGVQPSTRRQQQMAA
jgi:hypothetical protein